MLVDDVTAVITPVCLFLFFLLVLRILCAHKAILFVFLNTKIRIIFKNKD